jgi:hypothetical protein
MGVRSSQTASSADPQSQERQRGIAIAFFVSKHRLERKMKTRTVTCTLFLVALMLNLRVPGIYAQPGRTTDVRVRMTFSGNGAPSPINLNQPNTSTVEENVAGDGTLGPFTFRNVSATATTPYPSSTCSGLFFPRLAGAGVLRFQDGSLLKVNLTQGGDCIDLVHMVGHCTLTFQINGGTGRFQDASGVLTLTETAHPILADAFNNPVFFTETGQLTGTVSGMAEDEEGRDERQ